MNDDINIIIAELKKGNYNRFDEFYNKTKKQVYFAIFNILKNISLTENIMQDTYMLFLDKIKKYKDGTNVYAYLVTIARNLAINLYNKRKKEILCDITHPDQTYIIDSSFQPMLDLVYKTLSGLELEVFILHVIDEFKHREIADILDKPIGTITWAYNNAVKKLRLKVGDENEI